MAAQTNYSYSTPKGIAGSKFDLSNDEVKSRINDEADGSMKFGIAVATGANAGNSVKLPVAGTTDKDIEGVTINSGTTEIDVSGKVVIRKGATLGVITKGNVWGRIAKTANPAYHKPAYVIISGDEAGSFTDTSGATTVDIKAKFGSEVDKDNGIAVIEL